MRQIPRLFLVLLAVGACLVAQEPPGKRPPVSLPPWEPTGSAAPFAAPAGADQDREDGPGAQEPSEQAAGTRAVEDERRAESKDARKLLRRHAPPSRQRYLGIAILVGVLATALVVWALLRPRRR